MTTSSAPGKQAVTGDAAGEDSAAGVLDAAASSVPAPKPICCDHCPTGRQLSTFARALATYVETLEARAERLARALETQFDSGEKDGGAG